MASTFDSLAKAQYGPFLVPILPIDATLSDLSDPTLHKRRGKVPGVLKPDGRWIGFPKWTERPAATAEDWAAWSAWPGAGVGIRTGRVVGLDLDVLDEALSLELIRLAEKMLGPAPIRVGRRPKALMVYRLLGPPLKKQKINWTRNGVAEAVEVLGVGQQFVAYGLHPGTGKAYRWVSGRGVAEVSLPDLSGISALHLQAYLEAAAKVVSGRNVETTTVSPALSVGDAAGAKTDEELTGDPALVRAALKCIPNDLAYDDWIGVSMAVKAAAGEDAFDAWAEWSMGWADNTPEGLQAKWNSFLPPFRRGFDYVCARARPFGFLEDVRQVFKPIDDADVPAQETYVQGTLGWLLQEYAYVRKTKQFVRLSNVSAEWLDHSAFCAEYPGFGGHKDAKGAAAGQYLAAEHHRQMLDDVTYRPGEARVCADPLKGGARCLNLWTPSDLVLPDRVVSDAEVGVWLEFGRYLLPQKELDLLLDWCAAVLQRPDRKVNYGVLFRSDEHGIGKDLFMSPFFEAIGTANCKTVDPTLLASQFNSWCVGARMIIVPEMQSFDRKEQFNRLKPYLAAPPNIITINRKYQQEFTVPNLFQMFMFTNLIDAMAFERGDRRVLMIEAAGARRQPEYYSGLARWMQGGGTALFAKWLMQRDLSRFVWAGPAPSTEAKDRMRRVSMSSLEAWIDEQLADRTPPFDGDIATLEEIHMAMPTGLWGGRGAPSRERLASVLRKEIGAATAGRARVGGKRVRFLIIANHRKYSGQSLVQVRDTFLRTRAARRKIDKTSTLFE